MILLKKEFFFLFKGEKLEKIALNIYSQLWKLLKRNNKFYKFIWLITWNVYFDCQ